VSVGTPRQRERLARAQSGICPWCKLPLPDGLAGTAIDHIIPLCRGGPDKPWNRQLLHRRCNGPAGKGFKLTAEAEELAARHGVRLHLPIPASAHAYRPLTQDQSLRVDRLNALFYPRAGQSGA
jgi:hypothetical protein